MKLLSRSNTNFVHCCPMMLTRVKRFCSQFCSYFLMVVLAAQAFFVVAMEAKEMACHLHKCMCKLSACWLMRDVLGWQFWLRRP